MHIILSIRGTALDASYLPNFSWGHMVQDDSACGDEASPDLRSTHILSVFTPSDLQRLITYLPTSQACVQSKARTVGPSWSQNRALPRCSSHSLTLNATGTKAANHKCRHLIKIWERGETLKRQKIAKNKNKTERERERIERVGRREKQIKKLGISQQYTNQSPKGKPFPF